MHTLLAPTIVLLLFIVVRAGDLAVTVSFARDVIRTVLYGIVALLALIVLIINLL